MARVLLANKGEQLQGIRTGHWLPIFKNYFFQNFELEKWGSKFKRRNWSTFGSRITVKMDRTKTTLRIEWVKFFDN